MSTENVAARNCVDDGSNDSDNGQGREGKIEHWLDRGYAGRLCQSSHKGWLCNVRRARLRSTRGSLFLAPLVDRRGGGWLLEFRFSIHFCTACVAVRQLRAFFKFLSLLAPAIGQITTDPPGALSPRS